MEYIFQSERLGFRKWKKADLIPFCEMNSDKDVMEFFPTILSKLDSIKFADKINEQFLNYGYGLYAVEELKTTQFIGFIGFWHPSFELKHSVGESERNIGIVVMLQREQFNALTTGLTI